MRNINMLPGLLGFFLTLPLLPLSVHGRLLAWPDAADPLAGMGVNIHFTDPRPGELEMLAKAGFRVVRMDLTWAGTEKTPGVYDFSAFDRLLNSLDRFHIRALLILDYTNSLYDGGKPTCSEAGRAAFARWAVAAVEHFRGRGVIWEVWNEPNGGWFWKPKPNPDDYAKLAVTASRAIREAAPDEVVVGPALSGTNLDFVETAAKAGVLAYWNGITIHPYLRTGPEDYGAAYEQTRRLIARYAPKGRQIDVMCGESGYSTSWMGIDEATQARYLARLFLFDVMDRVPLTIWYDWHDDGTDLHNQEDNFGIVHHEVRATPPPLYKPKPAYRAAVTYAQCLGGLRFERRVPLSSPDDFALSFSSGVKCCFVAWTRSAKAHAISFPAPAGIYTAIDCEGKSLGLLHAENGVLTLQVDGGPKYLGAK